MSSVPHPSDEPSLPAAVLRPAAGNAFESTVEQLATAIRLGVFADGEQLPPERELASRLGVSRMTLREAIAALRDSDMVVTRRGRGGGTRVSWTGGRPGTRGPHRERSAPRRGAGLEDALVFRAVVEPGAAAAAARIPLAGDQRAWLVQCRTEVTDAPDEGAHRVADSRLHLAIATCTGSPMLVEAVTRAQAAMQELLAAIPVLPRNIAHSNAQHEAVVRAILDGDPDKARAAMNEHCEATAALLRGLLG